MLLKKQQTLAIAAPLSLSKGPVNNLNKYYVRTYTIKLPFPRNTVLSVGKKTLRGRGGTLSSEIAAQLVYLYLTCYIPLPPDILTHL